MWYLQAQYLHHKQEKSPFPSQPSTLLALFCSQIFTIFPMYGTGSPYLKQSVFSFFPIYFILFFNLVCFLEFSLCHQHIHYASERRFSCAIDWKLKLKTLYMFIHQQVISTGILLSWYESLVLELHQCLKYYEKKGCVIA